MSERETAVWFFKSVAIVLVVLIAAVCAWSIFGGSATCARACGEGRMAKWQPSTAASPEQCLCVEPKP